MSESTYAYLQHGMRFYFSSRYNQQRFMKRLKANRELHAERFYRRYGVSLGNYALADLMLYREIEKRGFRLELEQSGGDAACLEKLEFMGHVQVKK